MAHSKKATVKKAAAPASASTPPSKKHKPSMERKRDTMWFDSDDPCIECPICFDPFDAAIFIVCSGYLFVSSVWVVLSLEYASSE
jgi:hypothetical protein